MQTVTIDFQTDGSVKVETSGFVGSECSKVTADLEKALGVTVDDQRKPEFHIQTPNQARH